MAESGSGADQAAMMLIVNADDFGMTDGICRGALTAHQQGLVTSVSVLANGSALDRYVSAARDSGVGTGAHLAAVGEDPPLLSALEVPSLVDRRGAFPPTWQQFLRRAATGRIDPEDLRREFGAQIEHLRELGLTLSHLDSHQNVHLWPMVGRVLMDLATENSVPVVRVPRTSTARPIDVAVRLLSSQLATEAQRAGLTCAQTSIGLDEARGEHRSGIVDVVNRLLAAECRSAELVLHVAADPDPLRKLHPSRFRWAEQLAAVLDPSVVAAVVASGVLLGSFWDLAKIASPVDL